MALSLQQDGHAASQIANAERMAIPSIGEQREAQTEILRNIMLDVCIEVSSCEASDNSSTLAFAVADVLNQLGQNDSERKNILLRLLDHLHMLASTFQQVTATIRFHPAGLAVAAVLCKNCIHLLLRLTRWAIVITARSFSNFASQRFLVSGEGDGAGTSSSSYSPGES